MSAEQPSDDLEWTAEELCERALTWLRGRRSDASETEDIINAAVALTAALARAERERDEMVELERKSFSWAKHWEARVQKAEAVVEAARRIATAPSRTDNEDEKLIAQRALTAYDTPEIEGPCDEHPIKDWGP